MQTRELHLDRLAGLCKAELVAARRAAAARGEPLTVDVQAQASALIGEQAPLLTEQDREAVLERVLRDTIGLGPLDHLLADPEVEEVMVNRHDSVYVERGGRLERVESRFADQDALRDAIERILAPLGRRVDELSPMADARLPDGSRVNVVIPPLAVDGPAISIRRFGHNRPDLEQLVASGSMASAIRDRLAVAVADRRTVLISGGTGSGKTTVLNALSGHIPESERVVTIEDAAELRLRQEHVVRLESRPATVEGKGEVTIRDLLRNALRMRPDRIVLGEVRGPEALDLLSALNTGHEGALSTVHANSPTDALRRLETLCLMAGVGLPHAAIREQLARGIDLVLQLERLPDGRRRAAQLAEVVATAGGTGTRELEAGAV